MTLSRHSRSHPLSLLRPCRYCPHLLRRVHLALHPAAAPGKGAGADRSHGRCKLSSRSARRDSLQRTLSGWPRPEASAPIQPRSLTISNSHFSILARLEHLSERRSRTLLHSRIMHPRCAAVAVPGTRFWGAPQTHNPTAALARARVVRATGRAFSAPSFRILPMREGSFARSARLWRASAKNFQ